MKKIRLNCKDFNRIFRNKELCEMSELRSYNSARIVNDPLMLFAIDTNPTNTVLTIRLMQESVSFFRFPNKISFVDYSRKCIGRSFFVNRCKSICKLIPFEWLQLNASVFKKKLKISVPLYITWRELKILFILFKSVRI